jgi:hypothetical protein
MTTTLVETRARARVEPMPRPRFTDRLNLAALPTAVSCAQTFIQVTLARWGASTIIDDALIIVSELVTSAVETTGITDTHPRWSDLDKLNLISVQLVGLENSVVIEVWDSDPYPPAMKSEDVDAKSSHGLHLIPQVAHRYGSYSKGTGKVVWAELIVAARTTLAPSLPPLPRRQRRLMPEAHSPIARQQDPDVLRRVLEGLQNLGDNADQ